MNKPKLARWFAIGLIMTILLCGCWQNMFLEFDIPDLGIETLDDALCWVAHNITYESDEIHDHLIAEYWQDPYQTYIWRTGDCEDFSILLMYFMHRDLGLNPEMVVGYWIDDCVVPVDHASNPDSDGVRLYHAWVRVNGRDYESIYGIEGTTFFAEYFTVCRVISYEEALGRSTTIHRSITDE